MTERGSSAFNSAPISRNASSQSTRHILVGRGVVPHRVRSGALLFQFVIGPGPQLAQRMRCEELGRQRSCR